MKKKILMCLFVVLSAVILDQVTKGALLYLITGGIPLAAPAWQLVPYPYMMWHVTDFFNIVFTWNPGASFSMFRGLGESAPMVIVVVTGFIIGFICHYVLTRAKKYERLPLMLVLGGAIGNIIDRIRFGAVIDFLDVHIGGYHWPAFNVADICICVGVGLYLLNWFLARRKCKNECGIN